MVNTQSETISSQFKSQDSLYLTVDEFKLGQVIEKFLGKYFMSGEAGLNKKNNMNEQDDTEAQRLREVIEKIKQPPGIDDVLMSQNPAELLSNPAVAPETLDEAGDRRDDLKRDE